ncbi:MAG: TetR/AcrR family transcriptional regulator [Deltaproteobacteria bacterium]|nr:TetR/AcrR family transcriptional regulator [Nannocystaceae bacterium]
MMILERESTILGGPPVSSEIPATEPNPRARLAEAKRELYRAAIVAAAEAVFAEQGYEAARVQSIAKRAGVSLATFYGVFPGKWDAFRAVQQDRLGALMLEVGTLVMNASDAFDRLRFGLEGYLRYHMDHRAFLQIQLRERVPWGTIDELRTPEQTRAWETGLQLLIAAFREAMTAGLLEHDDAESCARTATAMSQVRMVMWVDRGMTDDPAEVARAAMLQFVRTFARAEQVDVLSARVRDAPMPPKLE